MTDGLTMSPIELSWTAKNVNIMAKNNGHQNFTKSFGIPTRPPYLGNILEKNGGGGFP